MKFQKIYAKISKIIRIQKFMDMRVFKSTETKTVSQNENVNISGNDDEHSAFSKVVSIGLKVL